MLKICVQSAPWYREDAPEESIRFIRECGFEGIDYNMDLHLRPEAIQKGDMTGFFSQTTEEILKYYEPLRAALQKYDVELAQMHAPFPLRFLCCTSERYKKLHYWCEYVSVQRWRPCFDGNL